MPATFHRDQRRTNCVAQVDAKCQHQQHDHDAAAEPGEGAEKARDE
jgi:hypothetical protein